MSTLSSRDLIALRIVRDTPCNAPDCPCTAWKTELADAVRKIAPDITDAQLAKILLRISGYVGMRALPHNLAGWAVGGLIAGAAADLAALELADDPGGGKT
jgi:hypothetical protein